MQGPHVLAVLMLLWQAIAIGMHVDLINIRPDLLFCVLLPFILLPVV